MAFSGITTADYGAASLENIDVSSEVLALSNLAAIPILDWLGDSDRPATARQHEYVEDFMLPRSIINSTAIASATAATAIQINGLGIALNRGQLLENTSAAPELMQVTSIFGANTIGVTRNYDGTGSGSLAAGGTIVVREALGVEGADHSGNDTRRLGVRKSNTVGLFNMEFAVSGSAQAIDIHGKDDFNSRLTKGLRNVLSQLEIAVVKGTLNAAATLGSATAYRSMKGIMSELTAINSVVAAASFAANPHLYIGDAMQNAYDNGADPDTEEWGLLCGAKTFRDISNLNDTKIQTSQDDERSKHVIRSYEGPFGRATVLLGRTMASTDVAIVPRNRIKVMPLSGRSFQMIPIAKSGDNTKVQIVGEYTAEFHHVSAMARIRATG